jgi:hypothetical protein
MPRYDEYFDQFPGGFVDAFRSILGISEFRLICRNCGCIVDRQFHDRHVAYCHRKVVQNKPADESRLKGL